MGGLRYQPQGRVKVGLGFLASRLVASVCASQYTSGVLGRPLTLAANQRRVVGSQGIAFQPVSAGQGSVDFGAPAGLDSVIPIGQSFSIYARVFVSVLGQRQAITSDHNSSGGGDSVLIEVTAANEWRFNVNAPSAINMVVQGVTLGWHDVLAVHVAGTGNFLYVDGQLIGQNSFTTQLRSGSNFRCCAIGAYAVTGAFRGMLSAFYVFKGDVSVARFALLDNPWQLFAAPEDEYESTPLSSVIAGVVANAYGASAASASGSALWNASGLITGQASSEASGVSVWHVSGEVVGSSVVGAYTSSAIDIVGVVGTSFGGSSANGNGVALLSVMANASGVSSAYSSGVSIVASSGATVGGSTGQAAATALAHALGSSEGSSGTQGWVAAVIHARGFSISESDAQAAAVAILEAIGASEGVSTTSGVTEGGVHYTAVGDKFGITIVLAPYAVKMTDKQYDVAIEPKPYKITKK